MSTQILRSVDGRQTPDTKDQVCIYWNLLDYTDVYFDPTFELTDGSQLDRHIVAGDAELIIHPDAVFQ